jgi:hypothetical protein
MATYIGSLKQKNQPALWSQHFNAINTSYKAHINAIHCAFICLRGMSLTIL